MRRPVRWPKPSGQEPPTFEITFYDNAYSCYQGLSESQITEQMRQDCWNNHTKPKLQEYVGIANDIGSPVCTKEWGGEKAADAGRGNGGGDDPYFIHQAFDFFHANDFTMEGYWNGPLHSIWPINDPSDLELMGQAWKEEVAADISGGGGTPSPTPTVGGYAVPTAGQKGWETEANDTFTAMESDVSTIADKFGISASVSLNKPPKGTPDWDTPYNENFQAMEQAISQLADALSVNVAASYPQISRGTLDWDVPMNDNITAIGADLQDIFNNGSVPSQNPSNWSSTTLGNATVSGSFTVDSSKFTMEAADGDLWSTADGGFFVYQSMSGDGTVTARVVSQENTDRFSKAGVMIRETLNASSKRVINVTRPTPGLEFNYRVSDGGTVDYQLGSQNATAPYWVRLVRSGDTFTAMESADSSTWTTIGTVTVSMNADVLAGIVGASNSAGVTATDVFDGLSLS